ncbi:PTS sugar transporter subunit IIC [Clostridium paraputrificum]|uniref:PTS mannose/fructose/sorbose/N-acetylgalactosamine transporter subunit IIC n=1 Tax=Clostridium paraputrificum TaxID=29363 RepID=UPI00325A5803
MLLNAFLVALVYYLVMWANFALGIFHINRPIIVGPLVGLVLGDLQTGIILGATFEPVFLGVIAVGGTMPADATIGTVMGVALAILTGADYETSLAIAVPVAMFGIMLKQIMSGAILPMFIPKMDNLAKEGNVKGMKTLHWIMGSLYSLLQAIAIFVTVWLGTDVIASVIDSIPAFITTGFKAAGAMLPAVGFALLLNMLFNKKLICYYFLGFVLCIYLQLPSLAIAIIAVVIAMTVYNSMTRNKTDVAVATNGGAQEVIIDDEEDFFNE